jgi:hypothetical protein
MRGTSSETAACNAAKLLTVTTAPPAPPLVPPLSAANPLATFAWPPEELDDDPVPEDELEELLDDELDGLLDEELELEDDELLDELDEELEDDELLDEELELEDDEPLGIEHSFTPPATRVPEPKVDSWQRKLPLINLNVNWSARP